jgi:hypothetical protein
MSERELFLSRGEVLPQNLSADAIVCVQTSACQWATFWCGVQRTGTGIVRTPGLIFAVVGISPD